MQDYQRKKQTVGNIARSSLASSLPGMSLIVGSLTCLFAFAQTPAASAPIQPANQGTGFVPLLLVTDLNPQMAYSPVALGQVKISGPKSTEDATLAATAGDKIYCLLNGTVTSVDTRANGDTSVEIFHAYPDVRTRYSGLQPVSVRVGDLINRGRVIGYARGAQIALSVVNSKGAKMDAEQFIALIPGYVQKLNAVRAGDFGKDDELPEVYRETKSERVICKYMPRGAWAKAATTGGKAVERHPTIRVVLKNKGTGKIQTVAVNSNPLVSIKDNLGANLAMQLTPVVQDEPSEGTTLNPYKVRLWDIALPAGVSPRADFVTIQFGDRAINDEPSFELTLVVK